MNRWLDRIDLIEETPRLSFLASDYDDTHLQESCFQTMFPQRIEYSLEDHVKVITVLHFKSPRNRPMPDTMEEIFII